MIDGVRRLVGAVVVGVLVTGCSGSGGSTPSSAPSPTAPTTSTTTPTTPSPTAEPDNGKVVWLCRPGHRPDPCDTSLRTTEVAADGRRTTVADPRTIRHPKPPAADCFYAYPTVSQESSANADLRVQKAERQVAFVQAARFSAVCDVWSPMYRQRTISDLFNLTDGAPDSAANRRAAASLRAGWRAFLAAHDPSRPVVLIGHSQGASMLIRLIKSDIDTHPGVRRQIAVALLLGGNVTVRTGRRTGGDFRNVPLCSRTGQAGCVIAYSSFPGQPPIGAFFGRPGGGVSLLSGDSAKAGLQVACVNPVAPGSRSAQGLHPFFPTALARSGAPTPWTSYPGHATAQCRTGADASWLQVSPTPAGRDAATLLKERLGALWGFHDVDVSLALGDLVADAGASIRGWHRTHG